MSLEILSEATPRTLPCGRTHRFVNVRCDCGVVFTCKRQRILSGATKSCGCLRSAAIAESNKRRASHGLSGHDLYHVWFEMMARCYKRGTPNYAGYGKRGITVAAQWHDIKSFIAGILKEIGPRPPYHELDRMNNNGNYQPGNVRWATIRQQARNRRSNLLITIEGVTKCLAEWAEQSGLHRTVISRRYRKGITGTALLQRKAQR